VTRIPIVILGAGLTGLGAAYRLTEASRPDFEVYEQHDYLGGHAASFRTAEGFTFDEGGHVLFSHYPYFDQVVHRVLGERLLRHQRESWIWIANCWVRYPYQEHLFQLPPDLAYESVSGLIAAASNGHRNGHPKPANFKEWIEASFGRGIARQFMIPYNEKVWAHPLETMDYGWIGERVATIDLQQVVRRLIFREESQWGPNGIFGYPLDGGFGGLSTAIATVLDPDRLHLRRTVVGIDADRRTVAFRDGGEVRYDSLVSALPMPLMLRLMGDTVPPALRASGARFLRNRVFVIGIGVQGPCPSGMHWVYFPEPHYPFNRLTFLSNYSPNVVPRADTHSLLIEIAFSPHRPLNRERAIQETITRLEELGWLRRDRILSLWSKGMSYAYPLPFLGRDVLLRDIHAFLEARGIYSRGRFGGWRYEVGNSDHAFMQGVEVVNRILAGDREQTYAVR
jgi:protoporphyrinogen oxidase